MNPDKRLPQVTKHKEHHIRVKEGPPITAKFCQLDAEKLAEAKAEAKAEFDQLERDGIIRRSDNPWASPLHMVRKPDRSWRPCGNYRRLNLFTIPDSYPLLNMMDFAAKMSGCCIFSKVDLRKGYHQIPMHARDIAKMAFITPFSLYEFLRMGFGLSRQYFPEDDGQGHKRRQSGPGISPAAPPAPVPAAPRNTTRLRSRHHFLAMAAAQPRRGETQAAKRW